jgi:hypothetical protein
VADEIPIPNSTPETPATTPSDPPVDQSPPADAPPADALPADDLSDAEKAYLNDGEKPAEDAEAAPEGPPEAYDLKAPEGTTIDPEALAAAAPVFKDLNLSNEQAQKLMPVAADFAQRVTAQAAAKMESDIHATRKEWFEAAKNDQEIGGAHWDETLQTAARGLDRLGYPQGSPFRKLLEDSGLQFHPDMIRAWSKVGKAIGEDSDFVRGDQNASVQPTDAELFYGAKD